MFLTPSPSPALRPARRLVGGAEVRDLAESRMPWISIFLFLWALVILSRLIWLQGFQHKRFAQRAERQHTTSVEIQPIRGDVRDRRGEALAISLRVESLYCNPPFFYPQYKKGRGNAEPTWGPPDRAKALEVARQLAPILEIPVHSLQESLLRQKPFVYLERQIPSSKTAAIKRLELEGVGFMPESRRFYPRGALAAQLIGFTNIDGQGQLGIEQRYQMELSGKEGRLIAPRDAHGRFLIEQENFDPMPVNGSSLQLTLDATIQHIVESALEEAVRLSKPTTAYVVVVDPNTGEILAMAGTPPFDPNQILPRKFMHRPESEWSAADREEYRRELEKQKAARRVHPVEDAYEPGSTMKIFTAAMALEERKVHLGERIDCMGGHWLYNPKIPPITDTHKHGILTFEEILWQSSNIGTAKMGIRLSPSVHYQYLRRFGFGENSGLNFPGETSGRLIAPDRWSVPTQYTLSYGYGLSVSPLQILMAGCAIANGGKLMRPLLVRRVFNDRGDLLAEYQPQVRGQVISEETSALMRETLKGVITQGTGKRAKLDGVEAFGKTGTARKLIGLKYDPKRHYASFMGFFPADKPQFGVLVMLDDPAGDVDGGGVAAPVFKRIGDAILAYRQGGTAEREEDLRLSLKDWPVNDNLEAASHVERGKVPDLRGLSPRSAVQLVVLAGGRPRFERPAGLSPSGARIQGQSPEPGANLAPGAFVTLRMGAP